MFVREGGAEDNPQRTPQESRCLCRAASAGLQRQSVRHAERDVVYSNTMANNIAYREQIGAEPRNRGKSVDDMLLVDEMKRGCGAGQRLR